MRKVFELERMKVDNPHASPVFGIDEWKFKLFALFSLRRSVRVVNNFSKGGQFDVGIASANYDYKQLIL